jgi:hypothetical protein
MSANPDKHHAGPINTLKGGKKRDEKTENFPRISHFKISSPQLLVDPHSSP